MSSSVYNIYIYIYLVGFGGGLWEHVPLAHLNPSMVEGIGSASKNTRNKYGSVQNIYHQSFAAFALQELDPITKFCLVLGSSIGRLVHVLCVSYFYHNKRKSLTNGFLEYSHTSQIFISTVKTTRIILNRILEKLERKILRDLFVKSIFLVWNAHLTHLRSK